MFVFLGAPLENAPSIFSDHEINATPIRAFIFRTLMDQAIVDQKTFLKTTNSVGMGSEEQQGLHKIFQRLKSGEQQIKVYEDQEQQRAARKVRTNILIHESIHRWHVNDHILFHSYL